MYVRFQLAGIAYEGKVLNLCHYTGRCFTEYTKAGRTLRLDLVRDHYELITAPTPKRRQERKDNGKHARIQRYRPQRLHTMTKETHGGQAGSAPELAKAVRQAERRTHRLPLLLKAWRRMRRAKTTPPTFVTMPRTQIIALQRTAIMATMPEGVRFAYLERERERKDKKAKARRKWRRATLMKAYRARA